MKHVLFPFVGDTIGGSHHSALSIIRNINKSQNNIIASAVLHRHGKLKDFLEKNGVECEVLNDLPLKLQELHIVRKILNTLIFASRLSFWLFRKKVDIIHTNDLRIHLTWTLVARLLRKKTIWHQRTIFPGGYFPSVVIRYASKIICVSSAVQKSLPKGQITRSLVIPNFVDDGVCEGIHINSDLIPGVSDRSNTVIFGFFANLREVKKPLMYLNFVAEYKKRSHKHVYALIFGEDYENYSEKMLKHAKSLHLQNSIHFKKTEHPLDWMRLCDYVVATSNADGFGRTIIEAMSVGTIVIATARAGHLEIITNNIDGFLIEPNDTYTFSKIVTMLESDSNMKKTIQKNGLNTIRTKFNSKVISSQIIAMGYLI